MTLGALIGREQEMDLLTGLIDRDPPRADVLLLVGDPGVGKSALLNHAESRARERGYRVLSVVGVEAEAAFPFAALYQLLHPLLDGTDRLAGPHRDALSAAFGLAEGPAPEPFLIALAAGSLLTSAAADRPVAVFADDVQWLDPQTHLALAFAARRIQALYDDQPRDPVLIVGAARTGHAGPFLDAGFPRLDVVGVSEQAASQILLAHAPGLNPRERQQVQDQALGNPLALLELPAAVRGSSDQSGGTQPPDLSARLERAFAGRIAELPAATREALLVTAVDPVGDLSEILAASAVLAGAEVTSGDLVPAEDVGLVTVTDTRIEFRHPLMRSGVLQSASQVRRQAAHAALADVLVGETYRSTRHRAESIVGPDDGIADALERNATVALSRGAVMAAIGDLERSAELTGNSARRGRRLLSAAQHAFGLGQVDTVQELIKRAAKTELSELDRARMEWLREIFEDGTPGDATRVFALCDIALRSAGADDPDLALNLLLGAALRCWWADTGPEARARVVETAEQLQGTEDDPRHVAILAVAEPVLRGREVVERLTAIVPEEIEDGDALRLLGMASHAVGHTPSTDDFLTLSENVLRGHGRLGLLSQTLGMQVMVQLVLGNLDRAAAAASEAERLAEETGQPIWHTGTIVCGSLLHALRGDAETALELAAEAELTAGRKKLNDMLSCVQLARGAAWLTAGRPRDAYLALRRAFDPADPSFHQRECFTSLMFFADAAARAGFREDAAEVVAGLEPIALTTPSAILHVYLDYARALLADDGEAEQLYMTALRRDLTRWPLARAKTELAYGSWLRRRGRGAEARTLLRSARAGLDRISAFGWADEARVELHGLGDPVVWPEESGRDEVFIRGRRIAALAAEGLSGEEIAMQLCVTPAVVGLHLLRSSEAAARIAASNGSPQ